VCRVHFLHGAAQGPPPDFSDLSAEITRVKTRQPPASSHKAQRELL
jgi:hypothetical protein